MGYNVKICVFFIDFEYIYLIVCFDDIVGKIVLNEIKYFKG